MMHLQTIVNGLMSQVNSKLLLATLCYIPVTVADIALMTSCSA
jgi:hypothetical protein